MKFQSIIMSITLAAASASVAATPQDESASTGRLTFVATTDVHGNYFPYNFITRRPATGSLARVAAYVDSLREEMGRDNVILLDVGDILQGQPTAYYYNFIDTASAHVTPRIMHWMDYDAQTIGNHDVETGHAVYDRYRRDLAPIPLLAANVIDKSTGEPYFTPYTVMERGGMKIAILGLLTPAIPAWLPENIWEGMEFVDMVESARRWVPEIMQRENPDILVGMFHAGHDSERITGRWRENASVLVADSVPGFDLVFIGHDHQVYNSTRPGGTVVLNGANLADNVAKATVTFSHDDTGKVSVTDVKGEIVSMADVEPSAAFMAEFADDYDKVNNFVSEKITVAEGAFAERDAYFGPSAFMDLIHRLQLEIAGADISFAAPLSFDARIDSGDVRMSDMFTLYKYENMLYTMRLTGQEIKDYLEMSYDLWTPQLTGAQGESLLRLAEGRPAKGDYAALANPSYNFDSAAGIIYEVDVTKPKGEKINIKSLADGRPFSPTDTYLVAINSYRGNGGGDLLTAGAGIPADELTSRIVRSTDKDLRYYLIQRLKQQPSITPVVTPNWQFVPEQIARPAAKVSRQVVFGEEMVNAID